MDVSWKYLTLCFLHVVSFTAASDCRFPIEWRGTWYQNWNIDISISSISRKGTCVQRHGNKFLMLNKDSSNRKCFRCLVFTQWHPNLLQYKESPCWYEESFRTVCSLISGDATLHTIVKVPSIPQPCPFQGAYTFAYTNGTMSNLQCINPVSEIRACADESKFKFVFRRCNGVPGTYDKVMDFQCLATWDNGEKFLYGRFAEPGMSYYDYKYRCFMHSFYGTSGDMSMSADATCQGLQNPTLGAISMKFSKDMSKWPRSACSFPDVLANQIKWRDLSGNLTLDVEDGLQVLRIKNRLPMKIVRYRESVAPESPTRLVIRCVSSSTVSSDPSVTDYIAYTTNDSCDSGHQCIRLIKRDESVIEMYIGNHLNDSHRTCGESDFMYATKHVLIPDVNQSAKCSVERRGVYQYVDKASLCEGTVDVGCNNPDEIVIETKCSGNRESVKILQCIQSWQTNSKTYLIIKKPGHSAECLTFIDIEDGIEVQADSNCQGDRWTVTNKYLNYLLYTPAIKTPGKCVDKNVQSDGETSPSSKPNGQVNDKSEHTGNKDRNSAPERTCTCWMMLFLSHLIVILLRNCQR